MVKGSVHELTRFDGYNMPRPNLIFAPVTRTVRINGRSEYLRNRERKSKQNAKEYHVQTVSAQPEGSYDERD
jgi:hypothetical protein